jgi:hypothetical protein
MTHALRLVKRFRDWANLLRQFYVSMVAMPPCTVNPEEMLARNTLDLEWRVTRPTRLADSDSLGYVRAREQRGAL